MLVGSVVLCVLGTIQWATWAMVVSRTVTRVLEPLSFGHLVIVNCGYCVLRESINAFRFVFVRMQPKYFSSSHHVTGNLYCTMMGPSDCGLSCVPKKHSYPERLTSECTVCRSFRQVAMKVPTSHHQKQGINKRRSRSHFSMTMWVTYEWDSACCRSKSCSVQ